MTGLIHLAKADGGTITINADGSISPSTAPIYSPDNITYTLTSNITANADGIAIERDNIILDGAGYTVTGSGSASGITLMGRSNVTVRNMTITNFSIGIWLIFASSFPTASTGNSSVNNTLLGNNIANNREGIELSISSDNNTLSGNNVTANSNCGIVLFHSNNNTLSGNTVANNVDGIGIVLSFSFNNTIYHNNFINNTSQVYSLYSANIWDNGSRGNYWSDYLTKYPNATQVDSSGVWNTPYVVDTNNTDHYPLMVQYVIPEFPSIQATMFFIILTLLAVIIYKKKGVRTSQS
jgi:parallel beta-helix repeat protein